MDAVRGSIGASGEARRWWTLGTACMAVLMVLIDVTIVNVALPTMQRDLHAKFAELQWVVNAYAVALAVALVTAGRLSDLYGRRRLFTMGLAVFTAGSVLAGLTGSLRLGIVSPIDALLGARAIQGIGGAVMIPVSLAIISNAFEGREKGLAIGLRGAMSGLGLAAGPILGLLIVHFGWPAIFYLNLPIGVAAIVMSYVAIDQSRDESARHGIDLGGTAALSIGVFTLVWGLIRIDGSQAASLLNLAWPFAISAAAFAALWFIEPACPHRSSTSDSFRTARIPAQPLPCFCSRPRSLRSFSF